MKTSLLLVALLINTPGWAAEQDSATFFNKLRSLCGTTFEGKSSFPAESTDSFYGKVLIAKIASCTDKEVRVPFQVGDDKSRTWIFTLDGAKLTLKHDHRHADGTPDAQTMYGGDASAAGSANSQSFHADAYTAKLIPAAVTNVWTVTLSEDGKQLSYHLDRHNAPRFRASLTRK
jgi:hypothetical protein